MFKWLREKFPSVFSRRGIFGLVIAAATWIIAPQFAAATITDDLNAVSAKSGPLFVPVAKPGMMPTEAQVLAAVRQQAVNRAATTAPAYSASPSYTLSQPKPPAQITSAAFRALSPVEQAKVVNDAFTRMASSLPSPTPISASIPLSSQLDPIQAVNQRLAEFYPRISNEDIASLSGDVLGAARLHPEARYYYLGFNAPAHSQAYIDLQEVREHLGRSIVSYFGSPEIAIQKSPDNAMFVQAYSAAAQARLPVAKPASAPVTAPFASQLAAHYDVMPGLHSVDGRLVMDPIVSPGDRRSSSVQLAALGGFLAIGSSAAWLRMQTASALTGVLLSRSQKSEETKAQPTGEADKPRRRSKLLTAGILADCKNGMLPRLPREGLNTLAASEALSKPAKTTNTKNSLNGHRGAFKLLTNCFEGFLTAPQKTGKGWEMNLEMNDGVLRIAETFKGKLTRRLDILRAEDGRSFYMTAIDAQGSKPIVHARLTAKGRIIAEDGALASRFAPLLRYVEKAFCQEQDKIDPQQVGCVIKDLLSHGSRVPFAALKKAGFAEVQEALTKAAPEFIGFEPQFIGFTGPDLAAKTPQLIGFDEPSMPAARNAPQIRPQKLAA